MCGRYFVDDVVFSEIEKIVPAICADIQKQQAGDCLLYTSLHKLVPKATPKMLTQQLRELENDHLIGRTWHPVRESRTCRSRSDNIRFLMVRPDRQLSLIHI